MNREFSAGGVVYKKVKERESKRVKVFWLITKSTPSELFPDSYWRLPKGWLDDNENKPGPLASGTRKAKEEELQQSALREVSEEGGVEARIVKKIGTETYFVNREGKKVMKFVTFYLMEWVRDLPEGHDFETSEVAWLSFIEARKLLTHNSSKETLNKAKMMLDL